MSGSLSSSRYWYQEVVSPVSSSVSPPLLLGMIRFNLQEGELEIGQVSSMINEIKPVQEIIDEILSDFKIEKGRISKIKF